MLQHLLLAPAIADLIRLRLLEGADHADHTQAIGQGFDDARVDRVELGAQALQADVGFAHIVMPLSAPAHRPAPVAASARLPSRRCPFASRSPRSDPVRCAGSRSSATAGARNTNRSPTLAASSRTTR